MCDKTFFSSVSSVFFRTAWNVPRLHYTITTKELSDSIRQLARLSAASTLSGVFPLSSPSMFVSINMSMNTPNCGVGRSRYGLQVISFLRPIFGIAYSHEPAIPTLLTI